MIKSLRHIDISDDIVQRSSDWFAGKRAGLSDETITRFHKAMNPDIPFRQRFKEFLRAENDLGRAGRVLKHGIILLTPFGKTIDTFSDFVNDILEPERTETMMFKKIISLKNFINVRDEQGRLSWTEVLASVIQIILAAGLIYGLNYFGILDALIELLEKDIFLN